MQPPGFPRWSSIGWMRLVHSTWLNSGGHIWNVRPIGSQSGVAELVTRIGGNGESGPNVRLDTVSRSRFFLRSLLSKAANKCVTYIGVFPPHAAAEMNLDVLSEDLFKL